MSFALFILLNAVLFLRPGDFISDLAGLPLYNMTILVCLATGFPRIARLLNGRALVEQPITACVLGTLAAIALSNMMRMDFWLARETTIEFAKVVLYYLLLVASLSSPARIARFLNWLLFFIIVLTSLSLLHYHGYVNLPALEAVQRQMYDESGDINVLLQLCGTGVFNDPNDFCLILVAGIGLVAWKILGRGSGALAPVWLAPLALLMYALVMTRSRGGLLALVIASMALLVARFGWRRAIPLGALVLPLLLLVTGGRQTEISTGADTAQQRIHLWYDGFKLLAQTPLTGIGAGRFAEEMGLVAHNSFVHAFTELGIIGGTCYFGVFYFALLTGRDLWRRSSSIADEQLRSIIPFLAPLVLGYIVGTASISRNYIVPTYIIPGVVTACSATAARTGEWVPLRLGLRAVSRLVLWSMATLVSLYLFVKFTIR